MWVLGHRGVMGEGPPENTMEAFRAAADLGVDGIETDVRLTGDGRLVLFHDRLAANGEPVAHQSHAELEAAEGLHVPEVAEALAAWPHLLWNLEVKAPAAMAPLLEVLAGHDPARIVLSSFFHNVIHAHAGDQAWPLGLLLDYRPVSVAGLLNDWPERPPDYCVWRMEYADGEVLAELNRRGVANLLYDVHSWADLHQAEAWGVAGVIMDQPELPLGFHAHPADLGDLP
jgi:glycerophosphoryl diester phosphodiesterase